LLRVRKGERVKLVMAAADQGHGFKLDDFNINQKIPKGTTVVVEFTADKAGTFQFRCSNVCGIGTADRCNLQCLYDFAYWPTNRCTERT